MAMVKVKHQKNFWLEHEGLVWCIDCAEFFDAQTGKGEFRVYRVEGDVTTPLLKEALEAEAQGRALSYVPNSR